MLASGYPTGSCSTSPRNCRACWHRRADMGKSTRAKRKPRPHEEAVRQLTTHYLLGPVARELRFDAASRYPNVALAATTYCQIEGQSRILYNDTIRLTKPQWLGVLAFA